LTPVYVSHMEVTVQAFIGGALVHRKTYALSTNAPTRIEFQLAGINRASFVPSPMSHFALDNLSITLPGSMGDCAFALSPSGREHGAGSATGSVSVATTDGCAWSVFNPNSWVTLLSSLHNIGSGTVIYRLTPNPTPLPRSGHLTVAGQSFAISQAGDPFAEGRAPVDVGHVEVPALGHSFLDPNRPRPLPGLQLPRSVIDHLVDQEQSSGGGGVLSSLSVNWDTNTQFALTVSAPPGHKFLVRVPAGREAGFGGFLWWESTRGGFSGPGSAQVSFEGLEGTPPDFSDSTPVLSDSHGFFGFVDVDSGKFAGDLAFTSMTLTATIQPQFTGGGTEQYTPHHGSSLQIFYTTPETNDPGPFVSIVPVNQPGLKITLGMNGELTVRFTGRLQHARDFGGPFEDVPGNPRGTYVVPRDAMNPHRFFRARED
jgi:hypothetical protein